MTAPVGDELLIVELAPGVFVAVAVVPVKDTATNPGTPPPDCRGPRAV